MKVNELNDVNISNLNKSEATVLAGKLIADAIDRHTEMQKKNSEIQMKMAGLAGDMLENMKRSLGETEEGEEWKRNKDQDEDEDDQDEFF